jgi:selenocysteine lyase/cysteine desulfurase
METYLARRATMGEDAEYERLPDDLRDAIAQLLNARSQETAFVQNTSEGLNLIANALPLEPGDNVVFCDMEFPSNVYPWMNQERRGVAVSQMSSSPSERTLSACHLIATTRWMRFTA